MAQKSLQDILLKEVALEGLRRITRGPSVGPYPSRKAMEASCVFVRAPPVCKFVDPWISSVPMHAFTQACAQVRGADMFDPMPRHDIRTLQGIHA